MEEFVRKIKYTDILKEIAESMIVNNRWRDKYNDR